MLLSEGRVPCRGNGMCQGPEVGVCLTHNHRKLLNLILMGSLDTQGLKEFKMNDVLNLKSTEMGKHLEAR